MIRCDLIYLAFNRLEFTRLTFEALLANTDWDRVDQLIVYDDGSTDGTLDYLYKAIHDCPVEYHLEERHHGSPVAMMNDYIDQADSQWFAKIDNDILCPPGWLNALAGVCERNPHLDLLGMEAGRMGLPPEGAVPNYGYEPCSHIGGVGLIQTSVLGGRRRMKPDGRFGWTQHQREYKLEKAWITPDLRVCSLDQVPLEPWQTYAAQYVERGWARDWPQYFERWMHRYWDWHPELAGVTA